MLNVAFIQKKYAYYNCTKIGDGQSIGDDNNYRAVPSTTPLDSTRLDDGDIGNNSSNDNSNMKL